MPQVLSQSPLYFLGHEVPSHMLSSVCDKHDSGLIPHLGSEQIPAGFWTPFAR